MAGKEKEKKPTAEELPEIAENIDSENIDAIDYYNAVGLVIGSCLSDYQIFE